MLPPDGRTFDKKKHLQLITEVVFPLQRKADMCIKKVVCSNCELLIGQYDREDQAGLCRKNLTKIQKEICMCQIFFDTHIIFYV